MRTVVIGKGFIESHISASDFGQRPGYKACDYRFEPSKESIERFIDKAKPDVVINCLGKTGRPNVDWCETHKDDTMIANVTIPTLLAEVTHRHGIQLVHIGSGCIFYGLSPNAGDPMDRDFRGDPGWKETDFANSKSYYSKSKYSCDLAISDFDNVCILRIRMPVSASFVPRNYITKILGYSSIIGASNSVTFMDDFVKAAAWTIDKSKRGVYHVTNPDPVTPMDFLSEYQKYVPGHTYSVINEKQLDALTIAPRSNCIIDSSKIIGEGLRLSSSKDLIEDYMKRFVT